MFIAIGRAVGDGPRACRAEPPPSRSRAPSTAEYAAGTTAPTRIAPSAIGPAAADASEATRATAPPTASVAPPKRAGPDLGRAERPRVANPHQRILRQSRSQQAEQHQEQAEGDEHGARGLEAGDDVADDDDDVDGREQGRRERRRDG